MKKESIESNVTICKNESHKDNKIILPIDEERQNAFNEGKSIEVTEEELKAIQATHPMGKHRWLVEVKNDS